MTKEQMLAALKAHAEEQDALNMKRWGSLVEWHSPYAVEELKKGLSDGRSARKLWRMFCELEDDGLIVAQRTTHRGSRMVGEDFGRSWRTEHYEDVKVLFNVTEKGKGKVNG